MSAHSSSLGADVGFVRAIGRHAAQQRGGRLREHGLDPYPRHAGFHQAAGQVGGVAEHSGPRFLDNRPRLRSNLRPVGARAKLLAEHRLALRAGRALDAGAILRRDFRGLVQPVEDVPGLDLGAGRCRHCGLAAEHSDSFGKGFLGCHGDSDAGKLVCNVAANLLACKPCKIICVETLGELVRTWREASGLSPADLAARVGGKVKRQHIEQLEAIGNRLPRYLPELARAMGASVDDLLALRMPPSLKDAPALTAARISLTPQEAATLADLRDVERISPEMHARLQAELSAIAAGMRAANGLLGRTTFSELMAHETAKAAAEKARNQALAEAGVTVIPERRERASRQLSVTGGRRATDAKQQEGR